MLSALVGRLTTHDIVFPLDLPSDMRLSPESGVGSSDFRLGSFCRGARAGISPSGHYPLAEPQWNAGFGASATGSMAMPQFFQLPSRPNSWYPGHIGLGGTHIHPSQSVFGCTIPAAGDGVGIMDIVLHQFFRPKISLGAGEVNVGLGVMRWPSRVSTSVVT